jgi:hypothetical protein
MTNPLIRILNRTVEREKRMTDEANDRREGYCDGIAGHHQPDRSADYREAREDGAFDRQMLAMAAEMKRRAALTLASA